MKPILFVLIGAALAKALAEPEELAPLYGQCGGFAYVKAGLGPTKCVPGAYCYTYNFYYAQCLPIPTPQPTPEPTPAPTSEPN
ncbi:hypothetical protein BJ165DRAFT_1520409 [Panaeolus papilionaceus]|nr:hypothetical protein BJ165DRAFT_1520409 [Panaeolus papilionaceus]